MARAPGSNTARSASAAPAGPFKLLPRNTERFETVGPGRSWLRVRPGRNSSPVSQVRRTTSAIIDIGGPAPADAGETYPREHPGETTQGHLFHVFSLDQATPQSALGLYQEVAEEARHGSEGGRTGQASAGGRVSAPADACSTSPSARHPPAWVAAFRPSDGSCPGSR
jgi:hypothetical protein